MRRALLAAAVIFASGRAASAAIKEGDQLVSARLGIVSALGAQQQSYSAGWQGAGEYLYQLCPYFGVGGEFVYTNPEGTTVGGPRNSVRRNTQMSAIDALARWNLTPGESWTPYAALGAGMYYHNETDIVIAQARSNVPTSNTNSHFWRPTGLAALGVDYINDAGLILGIQARLQTFSRPINALSLAAKIGLRFGK